MCKRDWISFNQRGVSLDAIPSYTTEKAPALTAGKNPDTGELANF